MDGEVQVFHKHLQDLDSTLKTAQTTAHIIRQPYGEKYCADMLILRKCLQEELRAIQVVVRKWQRFLDGDIPQPLKWTEITKMNTMSATFIKTATQSRIRMEGILNEEVSWWGSRSAKHKQKKENKEGVTARTKRPTTATQEQALEMLATTEKIIDGISRFSTQLGNAVLCPPAAIPSKDPTIKPYSKQILSVNKERTKSTLTTLNLQIMSLSIDIDRLENDASPGEPSSSSNASH
jgi:hypothetical protein